MSATNYQKLLKQREKEERERREREAAAGRESVGASGAEASVAIPSPGGEVVPDPPAAPVEPYRPQPFTPDLLPEPKEIDAEGDLTPQEVDDLEHCEAALHHGNRAEWMKWKAAHAIRSRRLYRQDGRTWPIYCEDRFGESESEVNRRIQQWPLLKTITEQQDRPRAIPDSHVQLLLPMVEQHGQDVTARAYVALRGWAAERKHRVTAEVVVGLVELAKAAETPALTTSSTFQRAIEAKPKPKPARAAKKEKAPVEAEPTPVVAEPDTQEQGEFPTGGHPNLGDSEGDEIPAAEVEDDGDEIVVDAEIVDDVQQQRAAAVLSQLQGYQIGFEAGALRGARPETLKEISTVARSIAEAAEEVLKNR
ncbi:hypothetical protein [Streptomyces geranii]|uniref:hypothetical protein n=1 Tax=Streptomyces geranii TaxID=2058923 RepID=UPI0018E5514A|nr:hypothetical protein [Streptomyces geranii]